MNAQSRTIAVTLVLACSIGGVERVAGQESVEAYRFLVGSWEGELEYLDYGDDRTRVRLPTSLTCDANLDGTSLELRFSFVEPSGRIETSSDLLRVTPEGLYLGDLWQVKEPAQQVAPGVFRLVLEREGEDNGQAATVVNAITLEGDELTITSTVTYEASGESLQRHQYRLRRSTREPGGAWAPQAQSRNSPART